MNNDMLPIDLGKLTDVGQTRDHNEDTIQTWHSAWDDQHGGRLFIVADGVGGESHGDIASQLTVQNTGYFYYETMRQNPNLPVKNTLVEVVTQVNQIIYQEAERRMSAGHMASTIVAAVLKKTRLTVAWLGDSRAYLIYRSRPGIHQITQDHSQVEEQFRAGLLTAEQAANHPAKNILSRSVGGRPNVNVDAVEYEVQSGDLLLICSDGLTRHVTDPELEHIARQSPNSQTATNTMIQLANSRGGRDNISAIVVYFGQRGTSTAVFGMNPAKNMGVPFDERETNPAPGSVIAQPADFLDENEASDATYDPAMVLPVAKSVPTNPGLTPQKKSGGSGRIIIGIILLMAILGGAAFLLSTLGGESAEPTEVSASPTIEASEVVLTNTPLPPSPTQSTATPTEDVAIQTSTAATITQQAVISVTEAESERRTAVYSTRAAHDTETAVPNIGSINTVTEAAQPTQLLDVSTATAQSIIQTQTAFAPTVVNNWEAGTRLLVTEYTGLSEDPSTEPLNPAQLSPRTIITVTADPEGRTYVIMPETGEKWWHVNVVAWGEGWLPESVLRLR